jgi:hypothetical protein
MFDSKPIKVVTFHELREAYHKAMMELFSNTWNHSNNIHSILSTGIPKLDPQNVKPFIKWAYARLETDLPDRYFLKTNEGVWAVSGDECIVWCVQDKDSI